MLYVLSAFVKNCIAAGLVVKAVDVNLRPPPWCPATQWWIKQFFSLNLRCSPISFCSHISLFSQIMCCRWSCESASLEWPGGFKESILEETQSLIPGQMYVKESWTCSVMLNVCFLVYCIQYFSLMLHMELLRRYTHLDSIWQGSIVVGNLIVTNCIVKQIEAYCIISNVMGLYHIGSNCIVAYWIISNCISQQEWTRAY